MCVSHEWCMYVPITHQYTSLHRLPSLSCPPCFLYHPYITHPTIQRSFTIIIKPSHNVILFPTTVAQTSVVVSYNQTGPLFAGTTLTLTCTLSTNYGVETVSTHWSGLDHILPPERYSVTPAMRGSDGSYTGTLTISPLAEGDDGTLSCTGTVTGGTESQSDTDTAVINITRMFEYVKYVIVEIPIKLQ